MSKKFKGWVEWRSFHILLFKSEKCALLKIKTEIFGFLFILGIYESFMSEIERF